MSSIREKEALANLPADELQHALTAFMAPVLTHLPEQRLRQVSLLAVRGILAAQSPVLTEMARGGQSEDGLSWPLAKRFYRFVANPRFDHRTLLKGLYGLAQQAVARDPRPYLVVAIDPVNFEKPYTAALEGVSTVLKSTPPGPKGEKRLTPGYPAITATIVNLPEPVITYANWFSYRTADFVSENREIYRALRISRALFPGIPLRFVGDSGLDDQKIFAQVAQTNCQFIFRATHEERLVEVYNERLQRWEGPEHLHELAASVPWSLRLQVAFHHAHRTRRVTVSLGWLPLRLPATQQRLWALVAYDPDYARQIILLTNVPLTSPEVAEQVYTEWRCRPRIEHTYRFDQEQGLDVEDMRVQTVERMRRVFVLVLLAALFVYHIAETWPQQAVLWLRRLGGKLGLNTDADGPYILLAGISAVLVTVATLGYAQHHPFPRPRETYG
jgi:hypothetical protein